MSGALAIAVGASGPEGAIISAVDKSGPASQAALRPGDLLHRLDGQQLNDARAFMRRIAETPIGKTIHLTIWRAREEQEVSVPVAAWPNLTGAAAVQAAGKTTSLAPHPGVTLAALTDANRQQYGLGRDQIGVVITKAEPGCEAEALGVQPGNVVLEVDDTQIAMPDQVKTIFKMAYEQRRPYVAMLVQTSNAAIWLPFSISIMK